MKKEKKPMDMKLLISSLFFLLLYIVWLILWPSQQILQRVIFGGIGIIALICILFKNRKKKNEDGKSDKKQG